MRALLHLDNRTHQVAFVAPELQQAAAVRFAYRVTSGTHVENHSAILQQRRAWMVGQIAFDYPGQLARRGCAFRTHVRYLPVVACAQGGDVSRMMATVP